MEPFCGGEWDTKGWKGKEIKGKDKENKRKDRKGGNRDWEKCHLRFRANQD